MTHTSGVSYQAVASDDDHAGSSLLAYYPADQALVSKDGAGPESGAAPAASPAEPKRSFNLATLKVMFRLIGIGMSRTDDNWALGFYLVAIMTALLEQVFVYFVGMVPSTMYMSLVGRDLDMFLHATVSGLVKVMLVAVTMTVSSLLRDMLVVHMRRRLTRYLHERYFRAHNIFGILQKTAIDNPDQRITTDVQQFCEQTGEVLSKVVIWPVLVGYYTYQSAVITGYYGLLLIFLFFLISAVVNKVIAGILVPMFYEQERREGDFRYLHVRLRSYSESICLAAGIDYESELVDRALNNLIFLLVRLAQRRSIVNLSKNTVSYLGSIVSYIVIGIPLFTTSMYDDLDPDALSALISQSSFINMYLIFNLTELLALTDSFAALGGYAHRVEELIDSLAELEKGAATEEASATGGKCSAMSGSLTCDSSSDESLASADRQYAPIADAHQSSFYPPADEHSVNFSDHTSMSSSHAEIGSDVVFAAREVSLSPPINHAAVAAAAATATGAGAAHGNCLDTTPAKNPPLFSALNVELTRGKHLAIVGPPGSGKSSLLRAAVGLWQPDHGEIQVPELETCSLRKQHRLKATQRGQVSPTTEPPTEVTPLSAAQDAGAPPHVNVLFLPQEPVQVVGDLRAQIVYPLSPIQYPGILPAPSRYVYIDNLTAVLPASLSHPRGADEDAYADADAVLRFSLVAKSMLVDLLERVGLSYLLQRSGSERTLACDTGAKVPWSLTIKAAPTPGAATTSAGRTAPATLTASFSQRLSPGERQKLAFARVLFHKPRLVLLDEATSSLDRHSSAKLYEELFRVYGGSVGGTPHSPGPLDGKGATLPEGGYGAAADPQLRSAHHAGPSGTIISVVHNRTLVPFHSHVLELGEGSRPASGGAASGSNWRLSTLAAFQAASMSDGF
ncbi:hypothetical protein H696_03532 [Fonticula alba]|uniref:ABC transmembrane type-1 domain-containing protein n=1 Tax=Fonticula alba TaxID=691883 RepID=A0A058Z711_FONAL|nr:hypothetical protein H696_03532 [Fonticula alba]KCV70069.1 hypothetical protein H696_03532 [Fonticula alba]|eukprot:XP_009495675.1 hypothetical protein H696_03532 [Fonticula alba]